MKSALQLRRAIAFRQTFATRFSQQVPQPRNYEGVTISDQSRFEDEPEPTEDVQISKLNLEDFFIPFYRVPLLEASPFLRVQELR